MYKSPIVYGIGTVLIDYFCQCTELDLKNFGLEPEQTLEVSDEFIKKLMQVFAFDHFYVGGTTANILRMMQVLGCQTILVGSASIDSEFNKIYLDLMLQYGVQVNLILFPELISNIALIMVLPSGKKTIVCNFSNFSPSLEELKLPHLMSANLFLTDGNMCDRGILTQNLLTLLQEIVSLRTNNVLSQNSTIVKKMVKLDSIRSNFDSFSYLNSLNKNSLNKDQSINYSSLCDCLLFPKSDTSRTNYSIPLGSRLNAENYNSQIFTAFAFPCAVQHAQKHHDEISKIILYADLIFGNVNDYGNFYKISADLENIGNYFILHGIPEKIYVVTNNQHGAIACFKGEVIYSASVKITGCIVDTTGAGDFFAGGFLHAFLQGSDLLTCLDFAHSLAAKYIVKYGTNIKK